MIPRFPIYLFDIDGALLGSAANIRGAIGLHLVDTFSSFIPGCTPDLMDALIQQYRATCLGRGHKRTTLYSGIPEALEALGGRKATATTKGTPAMSRAPTASSASRPRTATLPPAWTPAAAPA